MFCPECEAEYRPGFTRCSDCDVDLVNEAPDPDDLDAASGGDWGRTRSVWTGMDQDRCVQLCERLAASEIPFRVYQRHRQYLLRVTAYYKIRVRPEFFNDAKKVIVKGFPNAAGQE
jgi:hypothetical protein